MNQPRQKLGLTSVEAAALIESGGRTKDPNVSRIYAEGTTLEMDALQRAHLRRMMGFDFKLKMKPNKLLVIAKEGPQVRTNAKILPGEVDVYGNIVSPELINRLVQACVRLKARWDAENTKKVSA